MRYVLPALLCIVLTSCRQDHPMPSALQSFDTLHVQLQHISSLSAHVSLDVAGTDKSMQEDDSSAARSQAGRLQQDASELTKETSRVGARIQAMQKRARQPIERSYFQLVSRALASESSEGRSLMQLAGIVRSDPLIMVPEDTGRLSRSEGRARLLSKRAVVAVEAADRLRMQFKKSFRYVPVTVSR